MYIKPYVKPHIWEPYHIYIYCRPMVALVNCPVSFGVSWGPKWKNFNMSRSFSEMLRKCEGNRCFGAPSAVSWCCTRLFCWRETWASGLIFWFAICNLIPLVWHSIVTKRRRLWIKWLEWVSDVWWGALTSKLGVEPLLLRIKSYESRGGFIWLGCLLGNCLWCLHHSKLGKDTVEGPRGIVSIFVNNSGSPRRSLRVLLVRESLGIPHLACCQHSLIPVKLKKIDARILEGFSQLFIFAIL